MRQANQSNVDKKQLGYKPFHRHCAIITTVSSFLNVIEATRMSQAI